MCVCVMTGLQPLLVHAKQFVTLAKKGKKKKGKKTPNMGAPASRGHERANARTAYCSMTAESRRPRRSFFLDKYSRMYAAASAHCARKPAYGKTRREFVSGQPPASGEPCGRTATYNAQSLLGDVGDVVAVLVVAGVQLRVGKAAKVLPLLRRLDRAGARRQAAAHRRHQGTRGRAG